MSAAEEDDWENAGINLERLKLKADEASKPAFIMPPRLMTRPIANELNFLQDVSPIAVPSIATSTPVSSERSVPHPVPVSSVKDSEDQIDSALIDAVTNPRERMQVLNLENAILNFAKSSERKLEMPPMSNSFRRLLAYRVAQRFRLYHSISEQLGDNGERGIALFKTPDTIIPQPLLIDLPGPSGMASGPETSDADAAPTVAASVPPPKKVVMMKRNPDRSGDSSRKDNSSQKQQVTAEEREKAYVEARARIFGEEAAAAAAAAASAGAAGDTVVSPNSSGKTPTATSGKSDKSAAASAASTSTAAKNTNTAAAATASGNASGRTSPRPPPPAAATATASSTVTPPQPSTSTSSLNTSSKNSKPNKQQPNKPLSSSEGYTRTTSSDSLNGAASSGNELGDNSGHGTGSGSSRPRKEVVDAASWKDKRYTHRDVDAERSDPDFVRRSNIRAQPPPPYQQQQQHHQQQQQQGGYPGMGADGGQYMPMSMPMPGMYPAPYGGGAPPMGYPGYPMPMPPGAQQPMMMPPYYPPVMGMGGMQMYPNPAAGPGYSMPAGYGAAYPAMPGPGGPQRGVAGPNGNTNGRVYNKNEYPPLG